MKKAVLSGRVKRVAVLKSSWMEFTMDVHETKMNGRVFTLGSLVTCEVNTFTTQKPSITNTITNLSVGDDITVEMEKGEDDAWRVSDLSHQPHRGRPVGAFLDDVDADINR